MELTLDQALQKGVEAHKAGKVQEADQLYTAILKANPKHPDANHNMGVLAVGIFASGYPALQGPAAEVPHISFVGQLMGMIVMLLIGLVPGYICSLILNMLGLLRVGEAAERAGLDPVKVPNQAYPEGISPSATPAE